MRHGIFIELFVICLVNALLLSSAPALEYRQQLINIGGSSQHVMIPEGYRLELLTS